MKRVRPTPPKQETRAHMIGVGLDYQEGDMKRLTRGKNYTLVGGSEETHAVMQETAAKVNETLDQKGKTLEETSPQEFNDILFDVVDKIRR
ncbi:MAG: hypothetical protein PHO46_03335 [Thermoguttaceae bacterium]|nr:hypothetical protein [Thermoguttaceae bacterium]